MHLSSAVGTEDGLTLTQIESKRFEDHVLRIDLGSPAICMAYDFGRVLVQTVSSLNYNIQMIYLLTYLTIEEGYLYHYLEYLPS